MKWLVCINSEGVQCQIPTGKGDLKKAAEESKVLKYQTTIKFVFEYKGGGRDPKGDYEDQKAFKSFLAERGKELHAKYGAASPDEFFGYNLRKRYAMGDGIEILANLDADNYDEFKKKYGGIDGAIDILGSTERLMSPTVDSPEKAAKVIDKYIRRLEVEKED